MIGNKLNFKSHINELYQKPSQKIGALCRLSKFLNNSTKKQVSTQLQNPNSTIVLLYECSAQEHQTTKSTNYMRGHSELYWMIIQVVLINCLKTIMTYTITKRNIQLLLIKVFQMKKEIAPPIMESIPIT